jgi:hypothetical protein
MTTFTGSGNLKPWGTRNNDPNPSTPFAFGGVSGEQPSSFQTNTPVTNPNNSFNRNNSLGIQTNNQFNESENTIALFGNRNNSFGNQTNNNATNSNFPNSFNRNNSFGNQTNNNATNPNSNSPNSSNRNNSFGNQTTNAATNPNSFNTNPNSNLFNRNNSFGIQTNNNAATNPNSNFTNSFNRNNSFGIQTTNATNPNSNSPNSFNRNNSFGTQTTNATNPNSNSPNSFNRNNSFGNQTTNATNPNSNSPNSFNRNNSFGNQTTNAATNPNSFNTNNQFGNTAPNLFNRNNPFGNTGTNENTLGNNQTNNPFNTSSPNTGNTAINPNGNIPNNNGISGNCNLSSDAANKIIKQQMMNALTREDWDTLLLLSNSIKSWGNDAPKELVQMADDAIRVCNAQGFTTELVYSNLMEFAQNGPTDVKLLKAKLASRKREERKEINDEIDAMTKNAKTILQKLQESKATEEDISEFKEKFYLDSDGQEQINEMKKSSPTILRKAVRLQTSNERKSTQDLIKEVKENTTDPWSVLGLTKSLYEKLLRIFGSVENLMDKYVGSNLYSIFIGTMIFKFATVFICNILKTGGVGVTLTNISTGIGILYGGSAIAAVLSLVLFYYMLTACYGFISQQAMAHTVAGTGVMALGTGQFIFFMVKRMIKVLSWGNCLVMLCSISKDILGLIADLTINNFSLTISGLTLCTSNYNDFVRSVFLKGTAQFFKYVLYSLCQTVGTISGMMIDPESGFALVDFCKLYAGMASGIIQIFNPDVAVEDVGNPAKIVASQEALSTFSKSLNMIWTHNWFQFDNFPGFVKYWTSWFPNRNEAGEYSLARFLFNLNPETASSLSDQDFSGLLGTFPLGTS